MDTTTVKNLLHNILDSYRRYKEDSKNAHLFYESTGSYYWDKYKDNIKLFFEKYISKSSKQEILDICSKLLVNNKVMSPVKFITQLATHSTEEERIEMIKYIH